MAFIYLESLSIFIIKYLYYNFHSLTMYKARFLSTVLSHRFQYGIFLNGKKNLNGVCKMGIETETETDYWKRYGVMFEYEFLTWNNKHH